MHGRDNAGGGSLETARLRGRQPSLRLSARALLRRRLAALLGQGFLLAITSLSALAVLFLFFFITRDAMPFFRQQGIREFFTSTRWFPSAAHPEFGVLAIFVGSGLVTLGASLVAVPIGVLAAICLSDILPFSIRQVIKPAIEILAAIPSVAYGFFALVVLAPLLQEQGGPILASAFGVIVAPLMGIAAFVLAERLAERLPMGIQRPSRWILLVILGSSVVLVVGFVIRALSGMTIVSGTNALNVSVVLGIMALPTVVSVSEDALQAAGRELREGSYSLGATRSETILRVVLPAASGGIAAAVLLGIMRAIGETMVVWMASGNAAQIPRPWYNVLEPVRTLTATIAGDMGEADHVTGSARYHVLFAMALCLLVFSYLCNVVSEWMLRRARQRAGV